jgi:hypothetical protein
MSTSNGYEDVLNEALGEGTNGGGVAVAPPAPTSRMPGTASSKMTAPGTAPVGPRNAGAGACTAIYKDDRSLLTCHRRTTLRGAFLSQATLVDATNEANTVKVSDLVLTGLHFLSPVALRPGTLRQLKTTGSEEAKLSSTIRIVSCKVRPDGQFDLTAEFY